MASSGALELLHLSRCGRKRGLLLLGTSLIKSTTNYLRFGGERVVLYLPRKEYSHLLRLFSFSVERVLLFLLRKEYYMILLFWEKAVLFLLRKEYLLLKDPLRFYGGSITLPSAEGVFTS